jgi:hypothetical protein
LTCIIDNVRFWVGRTLPVDKRDSVYLVLEYSGYIAVVFGGNPEAPAGLEGEGAELEDGQMICGDGIADEGRGRVEAHVAA